MNQIKDPMLSVVVAIVSDTTGNCVDVSHLEANLEALSQQINPPSMEIVVPYHSQVEGIEKLRLRFPNVVFLRADDLKTYTGKGSSREHHDELRARGLAVARGDIIGLIEDHGHPDPYWCSRILEAHRGDYSAVGGAIENGINRALNWAVYFCDFHKYQNPVPDGESPFVSDANASYKRSALEAIQPVWQETFHETEVNWALISRGQKLALSPSMIVYQHRNNLKLRSALKERFIWGRSYAVTRSRLVGGVKRMIYAVLSPVLPGLLLLRMILRVLKKRRSIGPFLKAIPLTATLLVSWSFGEFIGYITGRI